MPQSNPTISSDAQKNKFQIPTSQRSSSFSTTTITLSNKQCSQTRHSSTKDHSKLHHQNPIPQSGQATMLSNKTFIYQDHSKLHHQNPIPQSGQATMALNQTNKRESLKLPSSKTQYHKSNTTISYDTQKIKFQVPN
jgi:hypothetical protein